MAGEWRSRQVTSTHFTDQPIEYFESHWYLVVCAILIPAVTSRTHSYHNSHIPILGIKPLHDSWLCDPIPGYVFLVHFFNGWAASDWWLVLVLWWTCESCLVNTCEEVKWVYVWVGKERKRPKFIQALDSFIACYITRIYHPSNPSCLHRLGMFVEQLGKLLLYLDRLGSDENSLSDLRAKAWGHIPCVPLTLFHLQLGSTKPPCSLTEVPWNPMNIIGLNQIHQRKRQLPLRSPQRPLKSPGCRGWGWHLCCRLWGRLLDNISLGHQDGIRSTWCWCELGDECDKIWRKAVYDVDRKEIGWYCM
jgi:hypothetical protein